MLCADGIPALAQECGGRHLETGGDLRMPDSRRQVLAQQSDATEGAAQRSAVTARRSASLATLSAAPRRMTSSGTALTVPAHPYISLSHCNPINYNLRPKDRQSGTLPCLLRPA